MSVNVRPDGRVFLIGETAYQLPTAEGSDGNAWRVKNKGPLAVTATAPSGQTVDGVASVVIPAGRTATFASDGVSNWDMFSGGEEATPPGSIPAGVIVMWSGTLATVPVGWLLCDGQNNTPDLRDRFIKGANGEPGGAGGAATHIHDSHGALAHASATVADHPAQGHTGTAVSAHAGATVANHPALTHTGCAVANHTSVATKQGTATGNVVTTNTHSVTQPAQHAAQTHTVVQANDHTVTQPDQHAALAHTVEQAAEHPTQSHSSANNEPAFFTLAFIIKT